MRGKALRALIAAALLFVASGAAGQAGREFRSGPPGNFDYYILALSWSPTFCGLEGGIGNCFAHCGETIWRQDSRGGGQ